VRWSLLYIFPYSFSSFFIVTIRPSLSSLFPRFGKSFSDYFRLEGQTGSTLDVTESEIGQYMHVILCKNVLTVDRFQADEDAKEGQIGATFLHVLAREFESRGGYLRACL
jgi:hypothetical protein